MDTSESAAVAKCNSGRHRWEWWRGDRWSWDPVNYCWALWKCRDCGLFYQHTWRRWLCRLGWHHWYYDHNERKHCWQPARDEVRCCLCCGFFQQWAATRGWYRRTENGPPEIRKKVA